MTADVRWSAVAQKSCTRSAVVPWRFPLGVSVRLGSGRFATAERGHGVTIGGQRNGRIAPGDWGLKEQGT